MSKARIAFGLVFGAAALLAAMPRPAYAFKPDLEKCPLVKICKTVTRPVPQILLPPVRARHPT
jgi:hypothetical protein